jgi:ubiquinone/menaquinone biosynthesis C-methylase UbiE
MQKPQSAPIAAQQPDPVQHLMQFASGYVVSSALWVAAELNVADLLKDGARPVSQLAKATQTNEDALYRTLRLLAMVGIFAETEPRHFVLTPSAEPLRTDVPNSMRDMIVWVVDPMHFRICSEWLHSVKTGEPTVEHVTGKAAFDYFASEAIEFERFHRAMTTMSNMVMGPVLEVYDFSSFTTVVDVAGGHGFVLCEVLKKYPKLKGVLFDMEDVLPGGKQRIKDCGLQDRCSTAAGDFFQSVPAGGDLYLMKNIIHDWDDEKALVILKNCRRALEGKKNGRVVLLELVVPPGNTPHMSKVLDIEMLLFPGGRERTEQEYAEIFARGGFRLTRVIPTKSPYSVVEAELA